MFEEIPQKPGVMAWLGRRPVYADEIRQLADVATESKPQTWKPANVPAQKLFRCVESLRDLEVLLMTAGRTKNKVKMRRKLKILLTPLHSLVEAVRDLASDLENNPDTVCQLPDGARPLVPQIRSQLLQISAIGKGSLLSAARNKISAHVDTELSEEEMRSLLGRAEPSRVGLWMHTCIAALADLVKLPVYFWSCEPNGEGSVRILFKEPFVIRLGLDSAGKADRILDVHMVPKPPRRDVLELMMRVVKSSRWMFGETDPRIVSFVEDKPGESWAKSLKWLPQLSGLAAKEGGVSVVPRIATDAGSFLLIPENVPFFVKESVQRITKLEDLLG
jgi:hypothetical protein